MINYEKQLLSTFLSSIWSFTGDRLLDAVDCDFYSFTYSDWDEYGGNQFWETGPFSSTISVSIFSFCFYSYGLGKAV